jgi:formyltetrahydrofolate deformylase
MPNEKNTLSYILKVTCPDQKGLIAACAQVLAKAGANILDLTQHTATDINTFFLRALFECPADSLTHIRSHIEELAKRFEMHWELHDALRKKRIALLGSKTDHCLYELLLGQRDGDLNCDFSCLIANHAVLEPVARQFNIPFFLVPSDQTKAQQEERFREILSGSQSDAIVMARYMQILSADFLRDWLHKVINIHHGFLPAFKGAKPYHQAWAKGVKLIGATAHFATEDLDQGPIIWQSIQQVPDTCSIESFIRIGKEVEKRTLAYALRLWIEHKVFVVNGRTFVL